MEPHTSRAPVADGGERLLLLVAVVSAAVVVASVVIANIVGELSEPLWFLIFPVGMLGAGLTCAVALVTLFARRRRA